MLSRNLEQTLHRSLAFAAERRHEYATLEHLLLGVIDDPDAAPVLRACGIDLERLKRETTEFLDNDLTGLSTDRASDPKPTAGFQRVVQRAAIHIQSAGWDEVTGANVLVALFSERESQAVYFLQSQDMTRLDAVNFISHGIARAPRLIQAEPPPKIPAQGIGPHVEINPDGVINFAPAESLDQDGNHLPRLRSMHPDIRGLARELAASLSRGNAPHAVLGERVAAYAALIDQDLQVIDFGRLYLLGVRLANATYATERDILAKELPPLELPEQEKLDSLLALHGSFILATAAGAEAMADEERYRRRPAEERRYRSDAVAMAAALQNRPDLIDPDVAEQVLGAAQEVGQGNNPERSTVAGRAAVRNVMISLLGGAIGGVILSHAGIIVGTSAFFLGHLTVSESIKKTKWFQSVIGYTASTVNGAMDTPSKEAAEKFLSALHRQSKFVMAHERTLRRLAGSRNELDFIPRTLDWLKAPSKKSPPNAKN